MKKFILEAHRGVSSDYPENTLAAFRAAAELGYGMIELDTKFTADGKCVILHDRTVNRTARRPDGSKFESEVPISTLTFAEARELDYGLWFGERFKGEKIPTLEEAISFALEEKIPLKLDNVMFRGPDEQVDIIFDTIERMNALEYVGITPASIDCVKKTLARFPTVQIHYDGEASDEALSALSELVKPENLVVWIRYPNNRTSWCKLPHISLELAEKVHKIGRLGVWLLDKPEDLKEVTELYEPDYVETDGTLKP